MDSDGPSDPASQTDPEVEVPLDVIPLHSTNLLTVLDENGVVQYESPSIERLYGFEQAELVGERVAEYFHPEDREAVVAAFRRVVAGEDGAVEAVEYRHERADGTYVWVESVASADPTPGGYYVVNTRDVSDRKARERRLRRTNERLEGLASVVSHDLRNPLHVASARLELARDECASDHLAQVADAHERMESLIDELLTLSRTDRDISGTESVDLEALVETCWQTIPTADARLVTDVDRRLRADETRLRQLVENLVHNAVEHGSASPDSGARQYAVKHGSTSHADANAAADGDCGNDDVTVTVGELESGIYVEDDGPGVPPDDRDAVFEVGHSASQNGTGLGLSIVEQVAEAHGWDIRLTEGTDGGARFEITGVEFDR